MPDYGSTDRVRRAAADEYVEPARRRGEAIVKIHSGILGKSLVANNLLSPNRFPIVCNALKSTKFQKENGLTLLDVESPPTALSGRSSTLTFVYRLEPRTTTSPKADTKDKTGAPTDEVTFEQLRGILRDTYQELGGAEAFHRAERESWGE